jgi:hypothetical protein
MGIPALMTAEELLVLQPAHKPTELVRGVLIVREPAGSCVLSRGSSAGKI